jgi:hypothetical protein
MGKRCRSCHQSTKTPNLTKGFGAIWRFGALAAKKNEEIKTNYNSMLKRIRG